MTNVIFAFILGACSQGFDDKTPQVTPSDDEDRTLTPDVLGDGLDRDGDGFGETVDCDDNNPSINPDAGPALLITISPTKIHLKHEIRYRS